jgi:predicted transcriptional regulator YdeE
MNPSIVSVPELKIVAIKVVGHHSELSHRVPVAWIDLKGRLDQIPHKVAPTLFYGLFPESDHLKNGQNGLFSYWVGTAVSAFGDLPEGMVAVTVPAQTYAVATVKGDRTVIERTYIDLFGWLQANDRETAADSLGFELYDEGRMAVTPPYDQFDYDIYKPLA